MLPRDRVAALLAELDRARALGQDPAASPLWTFAPWGLRQQFSRGLISVEDVWDQLERWISFDLGVETGEPVEPDPDAQAGVDDERPDAADRVARIRRLVARATGRETRG